MTHLDAVCSYTKLFNLIGKYGGIAGVNMTKPNYRPSLVTWIWVGMNGSYIASALFTIITYDIDTKWMCANVVGISVQVYISFLLTPTGDITLLFVYANAGNSQIHSFDVEPQANLRKSLFLGKSLPKQYFGHISEFSYTETVVGTRQCVCQVF